MLTNKKRERKEKGTETNLTYFTSPFAITPLVHPQNDDKKKDHKNMYLIQTQRHSLAFEKIKENVHILMCGCMCI